MNRISKVTFSPVIKGLEIEIEKWASKALITGELHDHIFIYDYDKEDLQTLIDACTERLENWEE